MQTSTSFDEIQQMVALVLEQQQAMSQAVEPEVEGPQVEEWCADEESLDSYCLRQVFPDTSYYISVGEGKEIYQKGDGGFFKRINRVMLQREVSRFLQKYLPKQRTAKRAEDTVKLLLMEAEITGEEWVQRVNPDGYLNCTNGVLRILPCGCKLLDRDDDEVKDFIFLDQPFVRYDPDADRSYAEQLMFGSLEGESRQLFQRVMGASLNVHAVRQHVDRIPALNSPNTTGANGKSANNGIIARIHGASAVSHLGLEYFLGKQGDDPARNDLHMLAGKKVNLPAESESNFNLSNLGNLKAAITGDTLKSRGLFKDTFVFNPRCVFHFSLNNSTIINGTSEATTTRWRLLEWPFSFTSNPTTERQKKGDPRLNPTSGDCSFIDEHVLPGYLNLMIDGFMDACAHGFPSEVSNQLMEDNAAQHDHVADFIQAMGLKVADSTAKPWVQLADLHQLYLYWLREVKLDENDPARDLISCMGKTYRVEKAKEFAGNGKYDALKPSGNALGDYLHRQRGIKVVRPGERQAISLGIDRKTWVWLEPKDPNNLTDTLKDALFNTWTNSIAKRNTKEWVKMVEGDRHEAKDDFETNPGF